MLQKTKKLFFCNLQNIIIPVALLLGIMVSGFYVKNISLLYILKEPAGPSYPGDEHVINADEFQSRLAKFQPDNVVAETQQEDVAPSRNITLTGIIASNQPGRSLAIVMENGAQHTYREGDKLSTPPEGFINKIGDNTIEIKENGKVFSLILVERTAMPSENQVNNTPPENAEETGRDWDDYIITSPVYQKNALVGLRILPGKQKEMFAHFGLHPGDIVVKIDEYDLTVPSNIDQARAAWQQSLTVQLVIMRNNQKSLFNLSLNDINEKLINNHAQE
ncbi:type II secretion system protein N [Chimaeribacter arupi]|uniref:type II secretion system protein N n=1 Tax=Chimaeribacter arupi TaxID=2060066 RepID=UPI002947FDE6|nr:type II secretion system protein N [Chimaeribacter arupi]MDV5142612.1 type II secretion system protein N [Chimaeribacter arupi]